MKLGYQQKKRAVKGSHLLEASPQQIEELLPKSKAIIAIHYHELKQLSALNPQLLTDASIDCCDLLVLLDEDVPLFPTARPYVEKHIPWHVDEINKLSTPLSTMGGQPHRFICAFILNIETHHFQLKLALQ